MATKIFVNLSVKNLNKSVQVTDPKGVIIQLVQWISEVNPQR